MHDRRERDGVPVEDLATISGRQGGRAGTDG